MTSAVWAGTVFGPRLWQLSARRHSLAVQKYKRLIVATIFATTSVKIYCIL